jgi:prephenate dehydrogenase
MRRAAVIGTGLIGGSIGMALRAAGWHVTGSDADAARAAKAVELGALDATGDDPEAEITFVATPVRALAAEAERALRTTSGIVTDVGSVKRLLVDTVADPRFVGGHPMAGSEQEGVEGASATLFEGAVWVLTPSATTDDQAYVLVRSVVSSFGADIVSIPADRHDALVAVVSHVPHLTAATLMQLADERADDHGAVLRLAAGGFRDMTRIASGHPGIWPDICADNREAITVALDDLIGRLSDVRDAVAKSDREVLREHLEAAREARLNLPSGVERSDELAELRIPVPDRPGTLADVTSLATDLDINIVDLEIAHSSEGAGGVLVIVVAAHAIDAFRDALTDQGYRSSVRLLQ